MLKRSNVIVEITPTRLEVAVLRAGQVEQVRAERFNPPETNADLADVLRARHSTLAMWVTELGIQSSPTTIVFSTPTTTCSLFACPTSAGPAAIERASRMALSEVAGYPTGEHPTDSQLIASDTQAITRAGSAMDAAGQRMSHSIAAVEQEATTQLLSQWVSSCGLSVSRLVPTIAGAIATSASRLMATPVGPAPVGTLWFGEHEAFLMIGDHAGLRLFRTISLGVEGLVEALQRPITPRTSGSETVSIDRAAARSMLERFGIPQAADLIDARLDFSGQSILPLLSPALQRAAVELKQSIRFGLGEKDRAGIRVSLCGPGSALPRLAEVLSQLSGIEIVASQPATAVGFSASSSSAIGNIAQVVASPALELSLLPAALQQEQFATRARRALWVGIAASIALVGFYAGWNALSLAAAERQITALTVQADEAKRIDDQRRALLMTQNASRGAAVLIADSLGPTPDWSAAMNAIARLTPEHTQLKNLDLTDDPEAGPQARLSCVMNAADDPAVALQLKAYIESLMALPIVTSVKMGGTTRATADGVDQYTFDLNVGLVALPFSHVSRNALKDALTETTPPLRTAAAAPTQASADANTAAGGNP